VLLPGGHDCVNGGLYDRKRGAGCPPLQQPCKEKAESGESIGRALAISPREREKGTGEHLLKMKRKKSSRDSPNTGDPSQERTGNER